MLDELGQLRLCLTHVDERIAVVAEHPEVTVEVEVHRRRLQARGIPGVDAYPTGLHGRPDVTVGKDAHLRRGRLAAATRPFAGEPTTTPPTRLGTGVTRPMLVWPGATAARSANRVSTSRFSCSRSSKDW